MQFTTLESKGARPRIAVLGTFITDLVARVERPPETGETVIGHSFGRYPGGKGANQAMGAARLGADVFMIGRVGDDDFGREHLAGMREACIDLSLVTIDPDAASGVANIVVDAQGRNRIAIVPGANHRITLEDVEKARDCIAAADILMVQLELQLAVTEKAMDIANQVGTPVILNPAPAQKLSTTTLAKATLLTPNEVEAGQLAGMRVESVAEAEEAARALLATGVGAVVITLGEQGALCLDGDGQAAALPAYDVQAVDTVAAGDAFNGALAVRLAEGATLSEAARYANAVAAISVTRHGAIPSMPFRPEVEAFLEQRRV